MKFSHTIYITFVVKEIFKSSVSIFFFFAVRLQRVVRSLTVNAREYVTTYAHRLIAARVTAVLYLLRVCTKETRATRRVEVSQSPTGIRVRDALVGFTETYRTDAASRSVFSRPEFAAEVSRDNIYVCPRILAGAVGSFAVIVRKSTRLSSCRRLHYNYKSTFSLSLTLSLSRKNGIRNGHISIVFRNKVNHTGTPNVDYAQLKVFRLRPSRNVPNRMWRVFRFERF